MDTRVAAMNPDSAKEALRYLRAGEVIAFPTDTVYGVGADGLSPDAIEKLYGVKERPGKKAIPLLLAEAAQAANVAAELNERARLLMQEFWPGALTLVVRAEEVVPAVLRAEDGTVALRVPNHAWLRALIRELGHPLAATSANISGAPDSLTAQQVLAQLDGRLRLIVDGGRTMGSRPSTVVDVTGVEIKILREGGITRAEIDNVLRQG